MSEAEQAPPPTNWPAPEAGFIPEIVPNDPDGSFFNLRELINDDFVYCGIIPKPAAGPWPDQVYEFSENQLLGNDIVDPSRASRLRAVIDALTSEPANLASFATVNQPYANSIKDVEDFTRKTSKIDGQTVTYQELLPADAVLGLIEQAWQQDNNPVHAVLVQLNRDYRQQIPAGEFIQLVRDVMFATQRSLILQMYVTHKRGLLEARKLALQEPIIDN